MSNVKIISGNLFNSKAQTIVNAVNCVGVMGKGVALAFKLKYPAIYRAYQNLCSQGLLTIGKIWLYKGKETEPWILGFPTKTHWRLPNKYEYVEVGLKKFVETYKKTRYRISGISTFRCR